MMNPSDPNSVAASLLVTESTRRAGAFGGDHLVKTLQAAMQQEKGQQLIHQGKWAEARSCYHAALRDLPDIPATAALRALLCAYILESHAAVGEYREAIPWSAKALPALEADPRWRPLLAACLANTGISLFKMNRVDEAIAHIERALDQFELVDNAAPQAKQCVDTLEMMREVQAAQKAKPKSIWSKLFG